MRRYFDILAKTGASGWTALDCVSGKTAEGATMAAALAALGARRGSRVAVETDAVFSQRVGLREAQTSGLTERELENALFFEIEPFCGLARADAVVAYVHAGPDDWTVAAAGRDALAALRRDVESARMRFAGAVAPGQDGAAGQPLVKLAQGGGLGGVAAAKACAIAAAAVAALCAVDFLMLSSRESRLRPALAESEAAAAENNRIRREIQAAEDRVREIENGRARREAAARNLAAARDAWLSLLAVLSEESGDDFAVAAMSDEDGRAKIDCMAPSAASAAAAMARLSASLEPAGWRLMPGGVGELGGGLTSFSFTLERRDAEAR